MRRQFYASAALLGALPASADIEIDATRSQVLAFAAKPLRPVSIVITVAADFDGDTDQLAADVRARVNGPVSSLTMRHATCGGGRDEAIRNDA